jgi:protein gp37
MGDGTTIEWTEASWTPIRARLLANPARVGWHCEHASPGCVNCYSETFNRDRLGTRLPFKPGHRKDVEIFVDEKMLTQPLRWRRARQIFVCSMTDLFGEFVTDEMIDRVFAVMALAPQHTFQVLTKRSARMRDYVGAIREHYRARPYDLYRHFGSPTWPGLTADQVNGIDSVEWPLPNVWLGVSVEDQQRADERIPDLLATPAAIRWLSCEPLLGPVDLNHVKTFEGPIEGGGYEAAWESALNGKRFSDWGGPDGNGGDVDGCSKLDWIVAGGESGPGARPMHPDWARSLRDQCQAAGVPFFFKQHGDWLLASEDDRTSGAATTVLAFGENVVAFDGAIGARVGKKRAGRLLDGLEHNGMPA